MGREEEDEIYDGEPDDVARERGGVQDDMEAGDAADD